METINISIAVELSPETKKFLAGLFAKSNVSVAPVEAKQTDTQKAKPDMNDPHVRETYEALAHIGEATKESNVANLPNWGATISPDMWVRFNADPSHELALAVSLHAKPSTAIGRRRQQSQRYDVTMFLCGSHSNSWQTITEQESAKRQTKESYTIATPLSDPDVKPRLERQLCRTMLVDSVSKEALHKTSLAIGRALKKALKAN